MASEICDSQLKPSGKFAPLFENHYFFNGKSHEMSIGPCSSSQTVGHYQRVNRQKGKKTLNHHFPMVFLWFSGFPMVFLWSFPSGISRLRRRSRNATTSEVVG